MSSELTSEDAARLRVPLAALPGLDPVGLDLVTLGQGEWAVHVLDADGPWPQHDLLVYDGRWRTTESWWLHGDGPELTIWAVDLADAATRDRVARWLAARVGLEVGSTAPEWLPAPFAEYALRSVTMTNGREDYHRWTAPAPLTRALDRYHDTRRLPDGSRYVDALALALVAVAVGAP